MKIRNVQLPVFGEKSETRNEWFDASHVSAVEGISWSQQCRVRVADEWRYVALPMVKVMEILKR